MQQYFQLLIQNLRMLLHLLCHRLEVAIFMPLDLSDWLYYVALPLLILAVTALPIGLRWHRFLQFQVIRDSQGKIPGVIPLFGVIAGSFILPGISEELFFRVLFLPHPTENASPETKWLWGCISLLLFIVYHPVQGFCRRKASPIVLKTFTDPVFLLLATFLGVACTLSYLQSGSVLTSAVIHWLFVVFWLLLLNGYTKVPVPVE